MLEEGYTHLYTGNGKGKTTAALGLTLRAAGAGLRSIIIQFMKGQHYNELNSIEKLSGLIQIEQYGSKKLCRVDDESYDEHYRLCQDGLVRAHEIIDDDRFSIIILDEIVTAFQFKMVAMDKIIEIIRRRPKNKELVLTGRGATQEIIDICDLVTEMKEIKHYYNKGVLARIGIEI
ncbi:MAG: cob(I)yrinic acid a,c-diamide adenosyltransferase [Spirochaetota bacterium]|nr:cob(I)yrinic acid a,c-diamide adenosyltransferase [Spirochaetota bacterium]